MQQPVIFMQENWFHHFKIESPLNYCRWHWVQKIIYLTKQSWFRVNASIMDELYSRQFLKSLQQESYIFVGNLPSDKCLNFHFKLVKPPVFLKHISRVFKGPISYGIPYAHRTNYKILQNPANKNIYRDISPRFWK